MARRSDEFKSVKSEQRICFGISWFATESEADGYAKEVQRQGRTYNGGYFHGMSCGRAKEFDTDDKEHGQDIRCD